MRLICTWIWRFAERWNLRLPCPHWFLAKMIGAKRYKKLPLALLVLFLPACAPSARNFAALEPHDLVMEFDRNMTIWGRPNMAMVREIHARGGITDEALAEYEGGALMHLSWAEPWGTPHPWDWEAMGLSDFPQTINRGRSVTSYTRHGAVTTTRHGNGTFSTRGTRTVRVVR